MLVDDSGHLDDTFQPSALDLFHLKDGRKSRFIKQVSYWYREEDAGDPKGTELNELVENMTSLSTPSKKKVGKVGRSNQKTVMHETIVMISATETQNDPPVVMDLSIFNIGVWNDVQPSGQQIVTFIHG